MRDERNISMSESDIAYITENYGKIPTTEMAIVLKIGLSKVWKNIQVLKLCSKRIEKQPVKCDGFYNEKNYLLSLEVP